MDMDSKNGVIQSSIALLQERFRQLQREKEMRARRELLRGTMIVMSTSSSSSSSDSESEHYNYTSATTTTAATCNHGSFKLLFADEVVPPLQLSPPAPPPPSHHRHDVALSLWPVAAERGASIKDEHHHRHHHHNNNLYPYGCLSCDGSHVFDDIDTSLHL